MGGSQRGWKSTTTPCPATRRKKRTVKHHSQGACAARVDMARGFPESVRPRLSRARTLALAEPSTLATDYLLGGFAVVLALRLWRQGAGEGSRQSVRLWAATLLAVAAAALAGGTLDGFPPPLPPPA